MACIRLIHQCVGHAAYRLLHTAETGSSVLKKQTWIRSTVVTAKPQLNSPQVGSEKVIIWTTTTHHPTPLTLFRHFQTTDFRYATSGNMEDDHIFYKMEDDLIFHHLQHRIRMFSKCLGHADNRTKRFAVSYLLS